MNGKYDSGFKSSYRILVDRKLIYLKMYLNKKIKQKKNSLSLMKMSNQERNQDISLADNMNKSHLEKTAIENSKASIEKSISDSTEKTLTNFDISYISNANLNQMSKSSTDNGSEETSCRIVHFEDDLQQKNGSNAKLLNFKEALSGQVETPVKFVEIHEQAKLYFMIPCMSSSSYEVLTGKLGFSSEHMDKLLNRYTLYCPSVNLNIFKVLKSKGGFINVKLLEQIALFVINSHAQHPLILSVSVYYLIIYLLVLILNS